MSHADVERRKEERGFIEVELRSMLRHFVLGERDAARYADGAPLNTDDRLRLEFSAPRALYLDTYRPNLDLMRKFRLAERPDIMPESRSP